MSRHGGLPLTYLAWPAATGRGDGHTIRIYAWRPSGIRVRNAQRTQQIGGVMDLLSTRLARPGSRHDIAALRAEAAVKETTGGRI